MTKITQSHPLERSTLFPTCLVIFACFCFGTIPYFAKTLMDAGMAPYAVAFYRYGLSSIVLLPVLLRLPVNQLKVIAWGVVYGISVGLGWIWFRDLPSKRAIPGASMVILAALIASSPAAVEPRHIPAMLLSLSAPISFGFGINVLVHKLTAIKVIARVATFSVGASLRLLPLLILSAPGTVLSQNPQTGDWSRQSRLVQR